MLPQKERFAIILRELEKKGVVKVAELSTLIGCSEVTIRSDIAKLDTQRMLKKVYGGAVKKEEVLELALDPGEL